MKYKCTNEVIPQEMREDINTKIEYIVNNDLPEVETGISKDDIFNACWTSTVTQDGEKVYYFNNYGVIKSCEPHKNFKRIMIVFGLNKDTFVEKIKKEIGLVKAKI